MANRRPIGVTILAGLTAIAVLAAIYHALQMAGLFPIKIEGPLGNHAFFREDFNWAAVLMWSILAVIYVWLILMLWRVDPRAWWFLVIFSIMNMILGAVSIIGLSSMEAMLPSLIVNGVILLYCLLPVTREAFDT